MMTEEPKKIKVKKTKKDWKVGQKVVSVAISKDSKLCGKDLKYLLAIFVRLFAELKRFFNISSKMTDEQYGEICSRIVPAESIDSSLAVFREVLICFNKNKETETIKKIFTDMDIEAIIKLITEAKSNGVE